MCIYICACGRVSYLPEKIGHLETGGESNATLGDFHEFVTRATVSPCQTKDENERTHEEEEGAKVSFGEKGGGGKGYSNTLPY